MNKHREAIDALRPFAEIFQDIHQVAQSISCSVDGDMTFKLEIKGRDLKEAARVINDWESKHTNPKSDVRPRCRTCGTHNYYENLTFGRCPFCEEEMRHFLMFSDIEKIGVRKKKGEKKVVDKRKEMAEMLRGLGDKELESFLKGVPRDNAVMYRELLRKY